MRAPVSVNRCFVHRVREKDPVLGIVTVKLSDLFKKSSEVTRLFSLQEGIGLPFFDIF